MLRSCHEMNGGGRKMAGKGVIVMAYMGSSGWLCEADLHSSWHTFVTVCFKRDQSVLQFCRLALPASLRVGVRHRSNFPIGDLKAGLGNIWSFQPLKRDAKGRTRLNTLPGGRACQAQAVPLPSPPLPRSKSITGSRLAVAVGPPCCRSALAGMVLGAASKQGHR